MLSHLKREHDSIGVKLLFLSLSLSQPIGVIHIRQATSFEKKTLSSSYFPSNAVRQLSQLRYAGCNEHMILLRVVVAAAAAVEKLSCRSVELPLHSGVVPRWLCCCWQFKNVTTAWKIVTAGGSERSRALFKAVNET